MTSSPAEPAPFGGRPLTDAQLDSLSIEQANALSTEQIGALSAAQIDRLTDRFDFELSDDVMDRLLDADEPAPAKKASTTIGGPEHAVDALRLLRRVSVRRGLRVAFVLVFVAALAGTVLTGVLKGRVEDGGEAWSRLDGQQAASVLGGIALLVLIAVIMVLAPGRGAMRRATTAIRPVVGRGPQVVPASSVDASTSPAPTPAPAPKEPDGDAAWRARLAAHASTTTAATAPFGAALTARLRRRAVVNVGALLGVILTLAVTVFAGLAVGPEIEASLGHGGPILTVGRDTSVVRVEHDTDSQGRRRTTYFVESPSGDAVVEGGRPQDGDRMIVVDDLLGHRHAVRVGGFAWVAPLLLALLFLAVAVCFGYWFVSSGREELAARRAAGHPELRADVGAMLAGRTIRLRVGERTAVTVGLSCAPGTEAAGVLRRRRRAAAVWLSAVGILLVGALGTGVAAALGYFTPPPDDRSVTVPELAGGDWDTDVFVSYTDLDSSTAVLHDYLDGLPGAGNSRVTQSAVIDTRGGEVTVNLDIADLGAVEAVRAPHAAVEEIRDLVAVTGDETLTTVTGLAEGWSGVVTTENEATKDIDGMVTQLDAFAASGSTMVRLSISGIHTDDNGDAHSYDAATLIRFAVSFSQTLRPAEVTSFADRTGRPRHG